MKFKVNLGNAVKPNFCLFDNLVLAKKAIREKLQSIDKRARVESSVSKLAPHEFGLGYRYRVNARTYTTGMYKISEVKE